MFVMGGEVVKEMARFCRNVDEMFGRHLGPFDRFRDRIAGILLRLSSVVSSSRYLPLYFSEPGVDFEVNPTSDRLVREFVTENELDPGIFNLRNLYKIYRGNTELLDEESLRYIANHLYELEEFLVARVVDMRFVTDRDGIYPEDLLSVRHFMIAEHIRDAREEISRSILQELRSSDLRDELGLV